MNRVIIFGGTGFIGLSLAKHLKSWGYTPVIIGRKSGNLYHDFEYHAWDARTLGPWVQALEQAIAIVNLTGKSVDCVKTPENIDEILRSRVDSTLVIGEALKNLNNPPKIWIQMSTAHIYGDSETHLCTENASLGYGLAPFVGRAWEEAFWKSIYSTTRGVVLRTSFVIGKKGGALKSLQSIAAKGLGGKTGSGKQGMSWIHEWDMNEIIRNAIENPDYQGIINVSSPKPCSNLEFMRTLRKVMKMPFGISSPAFIVRLGAKYFLKTDPELALYGRYIYPEKLLNGGFDFKFSNLEEALQDLIET